MPFEGREQDLAPDLRTPSLRGLSYMLRRKMPERFHWNFGIIYITDPSCGTTGCAIGLAKDVWPAVRFVNPRDYHNWARILGMSARDCNDIFFSTRPYDLSQSDITAEMVADKIDEYLAQQE